MAFQIKDDLFDYGSHEIGKPTGNDIQEKKLTLPLIYTLNHCDKKTRKELIYTLKNEHKQQAKIAKVIEVVKNTGGIQYAEQKMISFRDEALRILKEFDNPTISKALEELVRFTTDRTF
jgi:octaprenyl-diphosphate synthase